MRSGAAHISHRVRLGLDAIAGRHAPVSRSAEQGAPLNSPAARRRRHQRLSGAFPLHKLTSANRNMPKPLKETTPSAKVDLVANQGINGRIIFAHDDGLYAVAVSPDGKWVLADAVRTRLHRINLEKL